MNQLFLSYRLAFPLYKSALFERCETNDFIGDEGIKIEEDGQLHYIDRSGRSVRLEMDEIIKGIIEIKAWDSQTNELIHYFPIRYIENYCTKCQTKTVHFVGVSNVCLECGSINKRIRIVDSKQSTEPSTSINILMVNYDN